MDNTQFTINELERKITRYTDVIQNLQQTLDYMRHQKAELTKERNSEIQQMVLNANKEDT